MHTTVNTTTNSILGRLVSRFHHNEQKSVAGTEDSATKKQSERVYTVLPLVQGQGVVATRNMSHHTS